MTSHVFRAQAQVLILAERALQPLVSQPSVLTVFRPSRRTSPLVADLEDTALWSSNIAGHATVWSDLPRAQLTCLHTLDVRGQGIAMGIGNRRMGLRGVSPSHFRHLESTQATSCPHTANAGRMSPVSSLRALPSLSSARGYLLRGLCALQIFHF